VLQWSEIWSCLGAWVLEAQPALGPEARGNFDLVKNLDRSRVLEAARRRERYARELSALLGADNVLCIPTTPAEAPLRGEAPRRGQPGAEYYPRALALNAIAGIGRLPQVSVPATSCGGAPLGLSLVAARGSDAFLLSALQQIAGAIMPA
jgi:amidase